MSKRFIVISMLVIMGFAAGLSILLINILKNDDTDHSSGIDKYTAIVNGKAYDENNIGEVYCAPIDEAHVATDSDGMMYIDNEVLVVAADGVTKDNIEELAKEYDAEIVGCIEQTGDYQLKISDKKTKDELERIISELNGNNCIAEAY